MSGTRYLGLRLEGPGAPVEIVAAGCPASWSSGEQLPGGWSGVPSPGPRGMEVESSAGLARVVLEEQSSYTFRIRGQVARAGLRSPSGMPLTGAGASEAVFRIDTGNLVGLSALAMETADSSRLPDLPLRIRVRKLGDPDADFTWLVDSIVESIRALALTTQGPTALGVEKLEVGDPYPYEDLVFLRAIAGDAERAVRRIARSPHRRIVERREVVDAWLAREVSPSDLVSVAADGRNLAVVAPEQQRRLLGATAARAFTRGGRHLAPVRVPTVRREIDYDTYENRFVRFVLIAFRRRARMIRDRFVSAGRADLAGEAAALAGRFSALLREEPFDAVGDLSSLTVTTQVMLREDSYNAVLRLYREFMLCADITWDDFRLLHENHDVAEIYEIWVFLETVRAVAEILRQTGGARADLEDLLQINGQGLGVALERGRASAVRFRIADGLVSVLYNATFIGAGSQPGARIDDRSYSLPLRPDVTIEIERDGQCTRLLLDAKYRVDAIGRIFEGEPADEADEAQAVATGTFKSADIYKMHTYRDAIGGARIAVAVYPGTEQQLYPRDDAMFRSEGGVGAIPLAPRAGVARDSFTSVLDRLITAATDGQSAASGRERHAAATPHACDARHA